MRIRHAAVTPLVALAVAALAACGGTTAGGSPGGTGAVSGTVAGTTFSVASEIAVVQSASASTTCTDSSDGGSSCVSSTSGQMVALLLTNRGDATCGFAQSPAANEQLAAWDVVELAVVNPIGPVAAGTYALGPYTETTPGAEAVFGTTTSTCATGLHLTATSGTITLAQVSDGSVTGTYSATFGAQGTFTGSFDVAMCTLPDAGDTADVDAGPPVCRP